MWGQTKAVFPDVIFFFTDCIDKIISNFHNHWSFYHIVITVLNRFAQGQNLPVSYLHTIHFIHKQINKKRTTGTQMHK